MTPSMCYHCEQSTSEFFDAENGYSLVRCKQCGLLYVWPQPNITERSEAIRTGFHAGEKRLNVNAKWDNNKRVQYLQVLNEIISPEQRTEVKTVLDIGCGYGEFLITLKEFLPSGSVVEGFEPNEWKRNFAQSNGLSVHSSMDFLGERKVDLLSLLNVYSHLSNPCEDFRRYYQMLNPDGRLLIQTGDIYGLTAAEMPRPYFLPDHLSFASEPIIKNILEREGFVVEKVCRYPAVHFSWLQCIKEIIKYVVPGKRSNLSALLNHRKYAHRDMFILARKVELSDRIQ